jgi:hypothetical protein
MTLHYILYCISFNIMVINLKRIAVEIGEEGGKSLIWKGAQNLKL